MTEVGEFHAVGVGEERLSLPAVLAVAKYAGHIEFLQVAIEAALIRRAARELGIVATPAELQAAANSFRAERKLYAAADAQAWLAARHLTMGEWQAGLELDVLTRRVRDTVTTSKIEPHFAQHMLSFEQVLVSHLLVPDENLARELMAQIEDDGADFHALARRYSVDAATRLAGGYLGIVRRGELTAAAQAAVFGAQPGEVVGPFETRAGWRIMKLESSHPAQLDEATRTEIQGTLFAEWLAAQHENTVIQSPLLDLR
jgi:parvulin-like peptidyl-prolyl isomerase